MASLLSGGARSLGCLLSLGGCGSAPCFTFVLFNWRRKVKSKTFLFCSAFSLLVLWLERAGFGWVLFGLCPWHFWVAGFPSSKTRISEAKQKTQASPLCHSLAPEVPSWSAFQSLLQFVLYMMSRVFSWT